jgi:hypothetical protein
MRHNLFLRAATVVLVTGAAGSCDQLGMGKKVAEPPQVPSQQQLDKISYLPAETTGPNGRKVYGPFSKAKTCGDYEVAMRWNRPPNIAGGPFGKQMVYLIDSVPADLPKDAEVFLTGTIVKGHPIVAGGQAWYVRMKDGTLVQSAEMANYIEKQEQESQGDKLAALNQPNKPGRIFCGHGIYQGVLGKDPDNGEDKKVPLFSMLYAMDRDK